MDTATEGLNRVGRAALQKKAASQELTDAIRAAAAHHSQAAIGRAAKLTRARIHQIIHTKEES